MLVDIDEEREGELRYVISRYILRTGTGPHLHLVKQIPRKVIGRSAVHTRHRNMLILY